MYRDPKRAEVATATAKIARFNLTTGTQMPKVSKVDVSMQTEVVNLTPLQGNQALVMLDTSDVHVVQTLQPALIPQEMQAP